MTTFPLPEDHDTEAMHKAWARADLQRYLKRWEHTDLPSIPAAFHAFEYKACDIGCGFGKYLIRESSRHPDRGYLGIDKGSLRGGSMTRRFAAAGNRNLFGLHANAIPVIATMPETFLDTITIFYPNPWWPAKHRKKRWAYHPLLPKLTRILKPGGTLLLTSNETFYLAEMCYAIIHHPEIKAMECTYAGPIGETEGRTHFETKFIEEGIWCGEVVFQNQRPRT
ncbi:MAG: hypothetical protein QNK37_23255 [Acidobacteriota bacterium]|nr:hypothetical protein [Acidobacteriota bacterium]